MGGGGGDKASFQSPNSRLRYFIDLKGVNILHIFKIKGNNVTVASLSDCLFFFQFSPALSHGIRIKSCVMIMTDQYCLRKTM